MVQLSMSLQSRVLVHRQALLHTGAVKAAVIQMTQTHAKNMASDQIRVNCVAPGSIEFPGGVWDQAKQQAPAMYADALASIPFGRMGYPQEVAQVITFLLSERAAG